MQKFSKKYKKVLVFGVFDRLHEGHHNFLEQAKSYGEEVIAVVARDESVQFLKNKIPEQSENVRIENMQKHQHVSLAVLGDGELSAYDVIVKQQPGAVCLGYDQNWLGSDLKEKMQQGRVPTVPIIRLEPYKPRKFHTSFLDRNALI